MNLVGTRYATFLDRDLLVKAEDLEVPERLPVRCYREALGARLASRLGLASPPGELLVDLDRGRLFKRPWLFRAATPGKGDLAALLSSPEGLRILLLDVLIANHDRRVDNLLVLEGQLIPIDFNVAFGFATGRAPSEPADTTIMRWFGTRGVLALHRDVRQRLDEEISRLLHLLGEPYIHWAVAQIPDVFISPEERLLLLEGLLFRREHLASWINDWWDMTVAPLHRITEATDE